MKNLSQETSSRQVQMLTLFKSKEKTGRARILIVDDDATLVRIIERRFEHCGWEVISASDGDEGLDKAITRTPDLIILDILMPVMTGHEMLERLRRNPKTKDMPVIMCTARSDVQDIATASSYNISDYVTKPFDCTELIERIETALAKKCPQ